MKKIVITLLLLLTCCISNAYSPFIKNYHRDIYRAGTQTWAIGQSPDGRMYFANNDGLLEFNGEDWHLYRMNNRTSARSLYYDEAANCLYVGGTNELGRLDFTQSGRRYTSLLDSLGIFMNEIWTIGRDANGSLWFEDNSSRYTLTEKGMTKEAVSRYQLQGKVFCKAENDEYIAEGTTGDGIFLKRKSDGSRIHLTTENGLQNNSVLCLYFDKSGGLWAGLDQGIDYIMLDFPIFNLFGNSGEFGVGYAICDSGGYLWLGTNLGLFRVKKDRLGMSLEDKDIERIRGIDCQVWSIEQIGEEIIVCSDRGIHICRNGRINGFIPSDGAWKVEPLQEAPDFLLSCSYTRFFLLHRKNGSWEFSGWLDGFDEAGKSFEQDSDGRIWFTHHVKGLYRLKIDTDECRVSETERFGTAQGFPTDRANYPRVWRGTVIFSTEGGFYRFDNITGKALPMDELNLQFNGTPNSLNVFETPQGNMRYYSSGAMQAIEFKTENGAVLDSLSLRSLVSHRPIGFECIHSLDERILLLNSDDGFAVIDLDMLMRSRASISWPVFINSISNQENSDEVFFEGPLRKGDKGVIRLPHKNNSLEFNFIEPVFDSFMPTEYSSMLKGYDKQFGEYGEESSRTYSRIPSGRYTFIVRARNPLHGNEETTDSIEIVIERPWSRSTLAWILYIIGGILFIYASTEAFYKVSDRRARKLADAEAEKMRQAQIRKDLQAKADDLAASTMSLQRKNELLQTISGKIDDAVESAKNGDPVEIRLKRLRGISELIRENITHENDWQKFQDNFDLVYDDFLKRLGIQFPALSVNDKRICAYLRMGLGSKDIAPLLGMTVHSVEMTRYRIRQKMELRREDNLTAFLQKY